MRCTIPATIEWPIDDFYLYAIPLHPKKIIKDQLYYEMHQALHGMLEGTEKTLFGWKQSVLYNLWKRGVIKQTQMCIDEYLDFEQLCPCKTGDSYESIKKSINKFFFRILFTDKEGMKFFTIVEEETEDLARSHFNERENKEGNDYKIYRVDRL